MEEFVVIALVCFVVGGYTYHRLRRGRDPLEEGHQNALGKRKHPEGGGFGDVNASM